MSGSPKGTYDVFIDEAGDLGFKDKSSKHFIVAYVITENPHLLRGNMLRLKKKMNTRWKGYVQEFKFSNDSDDTKERVVSEILKHAFELGYVAIDKEYVKTSLRDPPLLYRYLVVNNVISDVVNAYDIRRLNIIVDKSLPKDGIEEFNRYLAGKLSYRQVAQKGNDMPEFEIRHLRSEEDPCLQVADYCSGAAFINFERKNPLYYDRFRSKLRFKNSWGNIDW